MVQTWDGEKRSKHLEFSLWITLSNSAKILKNIAKQLKGIDDKKKELNQFLQFLFINSNSNSFYSIPFQFQFLDPSPAPVYR